MVKYKIHGGDGVCVEVDETCVRLYKEKLTGRKEKVIPISTITGIDVKQPVSGWYSHMFFHVAGQHTGGHFIGNVDDNRVQLQGNEQYQTALKIQQFILSCQSRSNSPSVSISPSDEIRKLKQLADDGIITRQEFEAKKRQLLGL